MRYWKTGHIFHSRVPLHGKCAYELYNQTKESIEIIKNKGLTVVPVPEDTELEKFHEIHTQVSGELKGTIYSEKLLERVRTILKKIRNNQ